jgi:Ca-activated chloride channel homolog
MTVRITTMTDAEETRAAESKEEAGLGALQTDRGNLPLERIDVQAEITGLTSRVELTQDFVNSFDVPLEATYVFPLPDRGAVTRMQMTADGRVVEAELREREAARKAYDQAIASGRRASIAEEDRPDVFTMRVGNILPGERVSVALTLVTPLAYEDGEATFRFPLVVAPRYIPGRPLDEDAVGDGYADDTDAVPDASRITPPVLLPGFPYPVALGIDVDIDPAGLTLSEVRSSLHVVSTADGRIRVQPGERANRDFVLRLRYGTEAVSDSLVLVPDAKGDEGTYQLTVLPPVSSAPPRPRDLVLVLDRSGSMNGWKMVAARRAAARIVDTLTRGDRFAVLTFDDRIDHPAGLPEGLVEASDRHRYRAVEHLARVDARGGTEMLAPLRQALTLLGGSQRGDGRAARDAIVILVTDGQVGNEDQLLRELSSDLHRVRVHAVGIDQAVNAGFLGRLASVGGGRCELVESEDRLDEAMEGIHRRIGAPLAHSLALGADGLASIENTTSPARLPDLFPGVPLVVTGRYRGTAAGSLTLRGTSADGEDWSATAIGQRREAPAVTAQWARAHLRDLEDRYASAAAEDLEKRIVDTSLRFGVLCRFTAYVAVDSRVVVENGAPHRVMQPVELPAGWERTPIGAGPQFAAAMPQSLVATGGFSPAPPAAPMVWAPAPVASAMPIPPVMSAPPPVAPARRRSKGGGAPSRMVKQRNVITLAVVGVLLLGTGLVWSQKHDHLPATTHDQGVAATKAPESVDASGTLGTRGGVENTVTLPEAPPPPRTPADGKYKRDIITNGSMQIVVAQPAQAADRLVSAATDAGGRVDSRSEQSASSSGAGSPTVNLVLRIPADKLDGVLADAKQLGTVESMSIGHTDVTSQRVDLDARIAALQTSVTRLMELMGRAGNVADLLAAESSLTQRQADLDSLREQRATLGDEISYATINVTISAKPTAVHEGGFLGALQHGWRSLLSAANGVVLAVGFLLPWLPVLAVLALVVVVVVRRRSSRQGSQAAASSEPDDEAALTD